MPLKKSFGWLRRVSKLVVDHEKLLLAGLSFVIVISGSIWYREFSNNRLIGPSVGGTYVEGIVGGSKDISEIALKLTKIGLFDIDEKGDLRNRLIDHYTVNNDKTEYRFTLLPNINRQEIVDALNDNVTLLGSEVISQSPNGEIVVTLPQSNYDLPLLLTAPLFDYGPYKLSKTTEKTSIFSRSTRPGAVPAYLNKIIIQTFSNESDLKDALTKGRLDGSPLIIKDNKPANLELKTIPMPRYYFLMLNINKAPFRDASERQAAFNGTPTKPFVLTTPDSEPYITLANNLMSVWQKNGSQVTLEKKSLTEITNQVAPSRDFQAIITGVDYGSELDPAYIWGSDYIRPPGNNISGVKSQSVDQAINQIRTTYNILERQNLITALHKLVKDEGAGLLLQQDSSQFLLSKDIQFQPPWQPMTDTDRLQAIAQWWVK